MRQKVGHAIKSMWNARSELAKTQTAAGKRVDDTRGGRHLDPFIETLVELARHAGWSKGEVRVGSGIEVPCPAPRARALASLWVQRGDALLTRFSQPFDLVLGNPPYVRIRATSSNEREISGSSDGP